MIVVRSERQVNLELTAYSTRSIGPCATKDETDQEGVVFTWEVVQGFSIPRSSL